MGRYDGYLLLTDIDGTLVKGHDVSRENLEAIQAFQREGGLFTVATGRPPAYIGTFAGMFVPNTYVIATNGTVLIDLKSGDMPLMRPLDEGAAELPAYAAEHFPHMMDAHTTYDLMKETDIYLPGQRESFLQHAARIPRPWYKMIIRVEAAYSEQALKELIHVFGDRYLFERSWNEGIEIHSLDSGKDVCIRKLRELLPNVHTIIAAGDYENDIAMLEEADIGYAVDNALPQVKAAADRVTVSVYDHAIAHIIHEI